MGKSRLESLLACKVLQYVCLVDGPSPVYKVRIQESDLESAITSRKSSWCFMARCCKKSALDCGSCASYSQQLSMFSRKSKSCFKMSCWNCRGLSSSLPYLNCLLEDGSNNLVVSEHWLWPYNLCRLNEISDGYDAIGKSDGRLTEDRDGGRGVVEWFVLAQEYCCYPYFWSQF